MKLCSKPTLTWGGLKSWTNYVDYPSVCFYLALGKIVLIESEENNAF